MAKRGPFNKSTLNHLYNNCNFPVHRRELIQKAHDKGMGAPFMKALQQMPKKEYSDVDEIHKVLNAPGNGARPRA